MLEIHPEILSKNGKREFVVLPYEEFEAIREELEELEDLRQLDEAIAAEKNTPSIPWEEAKKRLGIK
ncbi:MAG: type II toxin-antitoxin system prevent-host-death family antitoxin [Verrucomicrobia bacterium]|nr:type II toxin-antitoxin system prevent-host-death family antitoxin [Verrucomicrobiota bacterium]